jgi:hypothetical protein
MKQGILIMSFVSAMFLIPLAVKAQPPPTLKQTLRMTPRTFDGGIYIQGSVYNLSGTLAGC